MNIFVFSNCSIYIKMLIFSSRERKNIDKKIDKIVYKC